MSKGFIIHRKSVTTNGVFTFASKVVAMLVPFIVYPYVLRVLGAESYGKVTYAESLTSYFSLLAVLGINAFAQRECAVLRDQPTALLKVASQSLALNIIMTATSFIIYLCIVMFVPSMRSERLLYLIFSLWIVASGLSMEWLYTAQERFDLISIREIIAKLLSLVLCYLLVRSRESYIIYGLIVVFTGTVFSMLWNVTGILRGQCGIIPNLRFSSGFIACLKPVFFLALLTVGSKLFTDFDVLMIKWFISGDNDRAVGLYNSAIILPKALDGLLMTVSAVITPQLFIATRNGDEGKVISIMNKTSNALFLVAVPAIITCLFFSKEIISLFAGNDYIQAAPVLQVYSMIIFGVMTITLGGTRTYVARQKEKKLFIVLVFGAILNIALNYLFIRLWGIVGASFATLLAYMAVMIIELSLEKTWHYIFTFDKIKYLIAGILVACIFYVFKFHFFVSDLERLFLSIVVAGFVYASVLLILKESTIVEFCGIVKKTLKK